MKYTTNTIKPSEIEREWHVIDVSDQILGRAATEISKLLTGKGKVRKAPNLDCGDYVIVINSDNVKVSGDKGRKKMYYRHSGYPGGFKSINFDKQMAKNSKFVIEHAVKNMLPNNKLRNGMLKRLFVYEDGNHAHEAQSPKEYKLSTKKS